MSLHRLGTRLARLETRYLPVGEPPYTPPEFPPIYWEEVYAILYDVGYLEETLQAWGIPAPDITALLAARAAHARETRPT